MEMIGVAIAFFGVMIGLPIAVVGGALGQGKAAAAAMEGIARQPEAAGEIRGLLIISLALIESLVLYAFVVTLLLMGRIPELMEVVNKLVG